MGRGGCCSVGFPHPLPVLLPSEGHVEAACLELAVLLAERAGLAAEVDAAVGAGLLCEPVPGPQLGAVAAGVEAAQPHQRRHQEVERPAGAAGGGPLVDDAGDPPEGDARAEVRQAACGDRSSASKQRMRRTKKKLQPMH